MNEFSVEQVLFAHTHNRQKIQIDCLILGGIGWMYIPTESIVAGIEKILVLNRFIGRMHNGNTDEKEASGNERILKF